MMKGIPAQEVLCIFSQILDGVEAAHLLGVTHRDLKPENILYDPSQRLFVVADFGIAHFEAEIIATAVETKKGDKLLNIRYSAPEQRTKGSPVDNRADIYALGQILNELFTGAVPDGAGHATIASVAADFTYLDALVEEMRQQNPSARPSSIADVKKNLIGHKNQFVALQMLDAKKREVVLVAEPGRVEPVTITSIEWDRGKLTLTLNRTPESGWIERFSEPLGKLGYMANLAPAMYRFLGNLVVIDVAEAYVQNAVNNFNNWSPDVTRNYQTDVIKVAQEEERKLRSRLEREQADADARVRVLSGVKF
jgi:serine/threonine protein kinase